MKITVDYNETDSNELFIESARYLSDYLIGLKFSDGNENTVDFKPFLTRTLHPSLKKFLNKNEFSKFSLEDGNLNWNDYEMIFPLTDLYKGHIL